MRELANMPDTNPKWILLVSAAATSAMAPAVARGAARSAAAPARSWVGSPTPSGDCANSPRPLQDGDLDANWVESMNSVMDDSRLLTLPSNERIRLLPHMKVTTAPACACVGSAHARAAFGVQASCRPAAILRPTSACADPAAPSPPRPHQMIFEIRDLKFATPATATRAGILYISEGRQWSNMVASWLDRVAKPYAEKAKWKVAQWGAEGAGGAQPVQDTPPACAHGVELGGMHACALKPSHGPTPLAPGSRHAHQVAFGAL